ARNVTGVQTCALPISGSGSGGTGGPAVVVARDAVVVAIDNEAVTVAVRDTDAARVAFAIVAGTGVPALRATRRASRTSRGPRGRMEGGGGGGGGGVRE